MLMPMTSPTVFLAEDDRAVRDALVRALRLEGYEVTAVNNGAEALEQLRDLQPDIVVLDVMMPFVDGFSVCRDLRARGSTVPVLMLTARTEVSDRVVGLDAGADDYLAKPFDLGELFARLRALLRRSTFAEGQSEVVIDDLRIDTSARRVWRGERELELSKTEFDLLAYLAANAGIVLDHGRIYEKIWGYDFGPDSKTLAVYVGYLRRKTEEDGRPRLIQTVRGVGYVLRAAGR
jgi:two-component system response regulator MprA